MCEIWKSISLPTLTTHEVATEEVHQTMNITTITVVIHRSRADNWYQKDACLPGPRIKAPEAQETAMLNSLQIAHGW